MDPPIPPLTKTYVVFCYVAWTFPGSEKMKPLPPHIKLEMKIIFFFKEIVKKKFSSYYEIALADKTII